MFKDLKNEKKKLSVYTKIKDSTRLMKWLLFGPQYLIQGKTQYMEHLKFDIVSEMKNLSSSKEMLDKIIDNFHDVSMVQFQYHAPASIGSTIKHLFLRNALEGAKSQ